MGYALAWKGAQIGRPAEGPGALAIPGRRLAAQLIDVLLLSPVFVALVVVSLAIAAPHFGPIFPSTAANQPDQPVSVPGFLWIGLLDPLWCLWDDKRQCLHDKAVDSIVINDLAESS